MAIPIEETIGISFGNRKDATVAGISLSAYSNLSLGKILPK